VRLNIGLQRQNITKKLSQYIIVGLVYNYRNSLCEDFTGDAKNVL